MYLLTNRKKSVRILPKYRVNYNDILMYKYNDIQCVWWGIKLSYHNCRCNNNWYNPTTLLKTKSLVVSFWLLVFRLISNNQHLTSIVGKQGLMTSCRFSSIPRLQATKSLRVSAKQSPVRGLPRLRLAMTPCINLPILESFNRHGAFAPKQVLPKQNDSKITDDGVVASVSEAISSSGIAAPSARNDTLCHLKIFESTLWREKC